MNSRKELHKIVTIMVFSGIIYLAFGVCMFLLPTETTKYFGYAMTACAALLGLIEVIIYFARNRVNSALSLDLTFGICLLTAAVLIFLHEESIRNAMTPLLGWLLLLSAVMKLQKGIDLARADSNVWYLALATAIISGCGAALLIAQPDFVKPQLALILRIFFCMDGAFTLLTSILFGMRLSRVIRLTEASLDELSAMSRDDHVSGHEMSPVVSDYAADGADLGLPVEEEPASTTSFFTDM
jgi:uncharacterized membrane protein HdeD (DUF308 family)